MKYLLTLLIIVSLASCSDSGQHYDDPWNPPTADRGYDDECPQLPAKDTTVAKVYVKS